LILKSFGLDFVKIEQLKKHDFDDCLDV
jgi:hypothetical protein